MKSRTLTTIAAVAIALGAFTAGSLARPAPVAAVSACILVYEDANYVGDNFFTCYPNNRYNLQDYTTNLHGGCNPLFRADQGNWNDCISSYHVYDLTASQIPCLFRNQWPPATNSYRRATTGASSLPLALNDEITSIIWDTNGGTCLD